MPLHVSSTCAHHQEIKIALHSLWYHHTYRFDDTRWCIIQFWTPDDEEHMCSKHVEAWNKTYCKTNILCIKLVNYWEKKFTCFGQFLCPSSGVFHCKHSNCMSYRFVDSLRAGSGRVVLILPDPARKLSTNLYDIHHFCAYSEKILMMDRGTVRNT